MVGCNLDLINSVLGCIKDHFLGITNWFKDEVVYHN